MNMKRTSSLILTLLCCCTLALAQKGLTIQTAFDELAVRENVTEVVMNSSKLKEYRLSFFHSIEVKTPSAAERQQIEMCVKADAANAILSEEGGTHRFYEMTQQKGLHRYILYRRDGQVLTLIYLEGKATLKQIKTYFQKKQ